MAIKILQKIFRKIILILMFHISALQDVYLLP